MGLVRLFDADAEAQLASSLEAVLCLKPAQADEFIGSLAAAHMFGDAEIGLQVEVELISSGLHR